MRSKCASISEKNEVTYGTDTECGIRLLFCGSWASYAASARFDRARAKKSIFSRCLFFGFAWCLDCGTKFGILGFVHGVRIVQYLLDEQIS